VRGKLINSMKYDELLDMIYIANNGVISKRRVKVIQIEEGTFRAYCYLRKSTRTFKVDNILAVVPVIQTESLVI